MIGATCGAVFLIWAGAPQIAAHSLQQETTDWIDALVGTATAVVFFAVGKFAIGLYLATTSYGAAGTFILILMWVTRA